MLKDARSDLNLWTLRVSSRLAAFAVVLVAYDRWYFYLSSYREDYRHAGAHLLACIVEEACRSSCTSLDLLRGSFSYKHAWTETENEVHEIVWPVSLRGRAASLVYRARWRAARSEKLRSLRARLTRSGDRR
jgi:CelD/BcsL family acetyltransferase involved in cellulose biosynthesis